MNKMLVMTLVVCVIIVGMIFSASLISGTTSESLENAEKAREFSTISDSEVNGSLSDVRTGVSSLESEITSISKRVDRLEQMHRQLAEQVIRRELTNYLDENSNPVPPAQINYGTLNSELASGQKKVQMTCTF